MIGACQSFAQPSLPISKFLAFDLSLKGMSSQEKLEGIHDYPRFRNAVDQCNAGAVIILDWKGIELATASYFAATILTLIRDLSASDADRYLISVGLNPQCVDDLKLALQIQGLVALAGDYKSKSLHNLRVLGTLDESYRESMACLDSQQYYSAAELLKSGCAATKIGKTGWNNRLQHLYGHRVIKRIKVGREFKYSLIA